MNLALFLFVVCGVLFSHLKATSLEQINEEFTGILMDCLTENPISAADLETMTNKQMPDNVAAKCLFACAYKKTGMMDEEGKFSEEGVRKLTKKYFADDAAKMKISDEFTTACLSVNNEPVGDGKNGCERAALMFECSIKKAPFDFI